MAVAAIASSAAVALMVFSATKPFLPEDYLLLVVNNPCTISTSGSRNLRADTGLAVLDGEQKEASRSLLTLGVPGEGLLLAEANSDAGLVGGVGPESTEVVWEQPYSHWHKGFSPLNR